MRKNNIVARKKCKYKITKYSSHNYSVSPNLINRNFTVDAANVCWVSDISYISTSEGWLYLCIILDLFYRMIVGRSMASHIRADLAIDALTIAVTHRKPNP
ncbi:MAG: DDE-type integrase/transposase/recombinase [Spirochaetota bacterium]|nr:DDE-type integrase/transposase/recombinase [Spirochaetota bacterium]